MSGLRLLKHLICATAVLALAAGLCLPEAAASAAAVKLSLATTEAKSAIPQTSATAVWTQLSAPSPRSRAAMAFDSSTGQLIMFGGGCACEGTPQDDDTTWSWNGSAWTPLYPSVSPSVRSGASMAYDPSSGQLLLFGGASSQSGLMDDTWTWNGSTWTELFPNISPSERGEASMAYDATLGELVLFGGNGTGRQNGLDNDTWTWNGSNWAELSPAESPPVRADAAMAFDPTNDQLVLFGGTGVSGSLDDTWVLDGSTWTQQCESCTGQYGPEAGALIADDPTTGQFLLAGGGSLFTWTWNGTDWSDIPTPAPPSFARFDASMAYDVGTGQLVLFGGANGAPSDDTWTFNGSAWSQVSNPFSPPVGAFSGAAFDSSTDQLLYLPVGSGGSTNATWIFAGGQWTEAALPGSPFGRTDMSMAYDESSDQLILFGGSDNGYLNDTWDWNGTSWSELSPADSPTPRVDASMAYDASLGGLVLFGGLGDNSPRDDLSDTWAWNGSDWSELSPAASPPAREEASMAYDSSTDQLVLFGGVNEGGYLSDTWTFDGTTWSPQSPSSSPAPRVAAAMSEDDALGEVVLFGGYSNLSPYYFGDTWSWDGTNWTASPTVASSPVAREGAVMAYDDDLGEPVLLGGENSAGGFADVWDFAPAVSSSSVTLSESEGASTLAKSGDSVRADSSSVEARYGDENNVILSVRILGRTAGPAPSGTVAIEDLVGAHPLVICTIGALTTSGPAVTGSCRPGSGQFAAGTDLELAVTAVYSGDAAYSGTASGSASSFKVLKARTSTVLTLSEASPVYGGENAEHFSAEVMPGYAGAPSGEVSVMDGSKLLCGISLSATGTGSCSPSRSALAPGSYSIRANYAGSDDFLASISAAERLTVKK